jgi:DNA-binding MltR family transcriptional regulator
MAKNALRELSRKIPSPPEIKKIMNDLLDRDDLNTAITAVSIVEAHLEKLIVSRLHRSDKDFTNRLFENRGPLSDFNSKILVAEAFGLLTRPLADELHVIRAIRNAFAHAKMTLTFDIEPVESEVRKLKLLTTIGGGKIPGPIKESLAAQLSTQSVFLLVISILLIIIDEIAKKKSSANKVLERALKKKRRV